jgi:hypothetical protein
MFRLLLQLLLADLSVLLVQTEQLAPQVRLAQQALAPLVQLVRLDLLALLLEQRAQPVQQVLAQPV